MYRLYFMLLVYNQFSVLVRVLVQMEPRAQIANRKFADVEASRIPERCFLFLKKNLKRPRKQNLIQQIIV